MLSTTTHEAQLNMQTLGEMISFKDGGSLDAPWLPTLDDMHTLFYVSQPNALSSPPYKMGVHVC
jgi:hypothetical protein